MFLSVNLKYLRSKKGLSQEQLGNELGIKRSTYKDYETGANEPGIAALRTLSAFFNVTIDELINTELEKTEPAEPRDKNLQILTITVNDEGRENIEFVPMKARAGYLTGFNNPGYIGTLSRFRMPNLPMGTYRAFEIEGDSMPPLDNGAIVIARYVEHWRDVKNLNTYVFITKSGLVYKRAINKVKQKGIFILLSDNAHYEPYYLPIDEVLEIWGYHAHFSMHYDTPGYVSVLKKLDEMEDIQGLKAIIEGK